MQYSLSVCPTLARIPILTHSMRNIFGEFDDKKHVLKCGPILTLDEEVRCLYFLPIQGEHLLLCYVILDKTKNKRNFKDCKKIFHNLINLKT